MKKIVIFVLILIGLSITALPKISKNPLFTLDCVDRVCFVSSQKFEYDEVESTKCGDMFFNYCTLSVAKENVTKFQQNLEALQFYISGITLDTLFEKLSYQAVSQSEVEGMTIYCGYTPYYQKCVYVDEKKVNIQIVCKGSNIVAGFPMILTGF